jgi:hypothetical protein
LRGLVVRHGCPGSLFIGRLVRRQRIPSWSGTERCFAPRPKRLAADTAYGTGKFLGWLVNDKGITPHILVWEKSDRADAIFSRADLIWDKRHGHYICANGKRLRTSGTVHDGRTLLYRASKRDCDVCPLRSRCCTRDEARKVPRDLHEEARDGLAGR